MITTLAMSDGAIWAMWIIGVAVGLGQLGFNIIVGIIIASMNRKTAKIDELEAKHESSARELIEQQMATVTQEFLGVIELLKEQVKDINNIAERSWLYGMVIDMAAECCWAGETYFEITRQAGQAYIAHARAQQVWPQGVPGVDQQHERYIRYATAVVTEGTTESVLLLETHYTAGLIERRLYRLEPNNVQGPSRSAEKLTLDKWPQQTVTGDSLPDREETGLSRPSIIRVPNGFGARSDYDGLIELQDSLHAANTQIGRVLAKYADPKLAAPETAVDPDTGNLPAAAEVYFFRSKDEVPQYITWNAELASAMEDRKFALSALATVAEMPLSLLGVKDDSAVESAAKMRLSATPALAKATRKSVIWRQAIRMAVSLAVESETGFAPTIPIGVEMRDRFA